MKAKPGKTRRLESGYYITCRCGLIFIGETSRQRYDEHTWKCEITLKEVGLNGPFTANK